MQPAGQIPLHLASAPEVENQQAGPGSAQPEAVVIPDAAAAVAEPGPGQQLGPAPVFDPNPHGTASAAAGENGSTHLAGVKRPADEEAAAPEAKRVEHAGLAAEAPGQPGADTEPASATAAGAPVPVPGAAAAAAPAVAGQPAAGQQAALGGRAAGSWDTVIRLVVPQKKAGLVIGKAGATVNELQSTTGARIQLTPPIPTCEERVVVLSAPEDPKQAKNGAQLALLALHRILTAEDHPPGMVPTFTERLLLTASQAAAVDEVDENTAQGQMATVRILPADQLPMCALSGDWVVQMHGTKEQLATALDSLAAQIRAKLPRERPGGPSLALKEKIDHAKRRGPGMMGGPPGMGGPFMGGPGMGPPGFGPPPGYGMGPRPGFGGGFSY